MAVQVFDTSLGMFKSGIPNYKLREVYQEEDNKQKSISKVIAMVTNQIPQILHNE